jgi:glycosyltransferase involved in cell wall biosynthesis
MSVIVPAYNEGDHLHRSLPVIVEHVSRVTPDYEIVVVDDGSADGTWGILADQHRANPRIKAIRLSRNFGKEYAIAAGLENCCGRAALVIDADLQHPPALIGKFYAIWKSGQAEVIEGIKKQRSEEPLVRRTLSRLFNRIATWSVRIDFNNSSDFKLLDRRAIDAWARMPERRCFFRGMATWIGFTHVQVEFEVEPRRDGRSKWSTAALFRLAWLAITSYSVLPLRVIHIWAAIFLAFAAGLAARALYLKFSGEAFTGFTTVIILLLLIGGLLLMSLGVIAEYVAAIYEELKFRPRYIITEHLR